MTPRAALDSERARGIDEAERALRDARTELWRLIVNYSVPITAVHAAEDKVTAAKQRLAMLTREPVC